MRVLINHRSRSGSPLQNDVRSHPATPPQPGSNTNPLPVRYEATAQEHESVLTSATVIDLGDSDSDDGISPAVNGAVKQTSEPTPIDPDDDIDESDPELREIIRETRRKKRLEDERKAMQGTPPAGAGTQQGSSPGAARGVSTPLTPPPQDPPVQLLITSRIPNTKPLIVARKLRQRLQEVRIAWCKKQGFDREMTDSVFFTFKGRRLFDVATCRSLGLDADCFGNVYMKGNPNWDENDGRITVEAVTQEIYQENLREARRQREPEAERELELEPEPEPKKTKIIVKTKDFGDVKFTCSPVRDSRPAVSLRLHHLFANCFCRRLLSKKWRESLVVGCISLLTNDRISYLMVKDWSLMERWPSWMTLKTVTHSRCISSESINASSHSVLLYSSAEDIAVFGVLEHGLEGKDTLGRIG